MLVEAVSPSQRLLRGWSLPGIQKEKETAHIKHRENTYIEIHMYIEIHTYIEIHRKYRGEKQCTFETERTERKVTYGVSQA